MFRAPRQIDAQASAGRRITKEPVVNRIASSMPRPFWIPSTLLLALLLGPVAGCPPPCPPQAPCRQCPAAPKGVVPPPTAHPDCRTACDYFVFCQSPRWDSAKERKKLASRCVEQCKSAKAPSESHTFFAGLRTCQVRRGCVAMADCLRTVVLKIKGDEKVEDPNAIYKVPVGTSPTRGPADAPVTMVMFADYECSFCVRAHKTVVSLLKQLPKQVRLVYKHYPLGNHVEGREAAKVALCVRQLKGDAAFWSFHDAAFGGDSLAEKALLKLAAKAGARAAAVKKCLAAKQADAPLKVDTDLGDGLGVDGTPMFFLNGKKLSGAVSEAEFKAAIAQAAARAKKAIAAGVKPADVYQHLTGKGHTRPAQIKRKDLGK